VLRGPQGTLFGAGSLAGTVRYITNQPDFSNDTGSVEAGVSTVDGGGTGGNVRAMMNMAMGDNAAMRLVGYYNQLPGYIDAIRPGGSVDSDVNDGTRQGARLVEKAVRAWTDRPVRFVVLTHHHTDHALGASFFVRSSASDRASVTDRYSPSLRHTIPAGADAPASCTRRCWQITRIFRSSTCMQAGRRP